jgi:predicted Zn-dependent protease
VFAVNANALEIFYDAQMDAYIKDISSTLVKNSNVKDVRIFLIKSDQLNAFATENKEIALYSGLIDEADEVQQIQGVIAHELGHLVAQHHIKSRVKNQSTGIAGIAGTILGIGAVIAGAPDAGMAAILGGTSADISKQLSYSREHENEADSIAIKLLKQSDISVKGLADFFKILERQERLYFKARPEFLNTHPSTSRRKSFIQNNLVVIQEQAAEDVDFNTFKDKLYAFTNVPEKVHNKYAIKEDSIGKYLALSISAMNLGNFTQSFEDLNKSRSLGLKDEWYFDMVGQIHYQAGNFQKSIDAYVNSEARGNKSWILDFQIAESYFALKSDKALDYYYKSYAKYDDFNYTLKRISDFYAQNQELTKAHFYLAQYNLKIGKNKQAKDHLGLAKQFYKKEMLDDENLMNQINEQLEYLKKKDNKKN